MSRTPPAYCNVLARAGGLDPIGYAGAVDLFLAFELPLPWPYALWSSERLPAEIRRLVEIWYGEPDPARPRIRPLAIAPDPAYTPPGLRRLMAWRRPEGAFADYRREAWQVPEDEVGPLAWALLLDPDALPRFDRWREEEREGAARDLLVCTHGSVDAACAKFGYPLYRELRERGGGNVRAWRVCHFGGHVFAPTVLDLPSGRYWAYVDGDKPARLLERSGDVRDLRGCYRGWAGLDHPFLQAAEREAWMREGWGWLERPKRGAIVARDPAEPPRWADVRLDFTAADGSPGAFEGRVERAGPVETIASTGDDAPHPYPQYRVARLERASPASPAAAAR